MKPIYPVIQLAQMIMTAREWKPLVGMTPVGSCLSEDVTKVAELIAKYSTLSKHG